MLVYPQPLNLETRAARLLTMSSGYQMLQRLQGKRDYLGGLVSVAGLLNGRWAEMMLWRLYEVSSFHKSRKEMSVQSYLFLIPQSQKISIKLRAEHPSNHIKHKPFRSSSLLLLEGQICTDNWIYSSDLNTCRDPTEGMLFSSLCGEPAENSQTILAEALKLTRPNVQKDDFLSAQRIPVNSSAKQQKWHDIGHSSNPTRSLFGRRSSIKILKTWQSDWSEVMRQQERVNNTTITHQDFIQKRLRNAELHDFSHKDLKETKVGARWDLDLAIPGFHPPPPLVVQVS